MMRTSIAATTKPRIEFIRVMKLHARYYDLFDIKDYYMRLSLPDLDKLDKYVDEPQKWLDALAIIRQAMDEVGPEVCRGQGRSRLLWPQDRLHDPRRRSAPSIRSPTNQLDFLATQTFDLKYRRGWGGPSGLCHPPRATGHA